MFHGEHRYSAQIIAPVADPTFIEAWSIVSVSLLHIHLWQEQLIRFAPDGKDPHLFLLCRDQIHPRFALAPILGFILVVFLFMATIQFH